MRAADVRDYVHVMDVADAHVRALEHLGTGNGCRVYNVGRGEGTSVQRMIGAIVADAWRWQRNNPHGYESLPEPTPVPAPVSSLA